MTEQEQMDRWRVAMTTWARLTDYLEHRPGCDEPHTEFCTCGLTRLKLGQELDAARAADAAQIASLRAQVAHLEHQKHDANCELRGPGGAVDRRCSCGFRALRAEVASLRAERDAAQQQIATLTEALKQFAECELNDVNCASVEVAARRVRNIARAALQHVNRSRHED